MNKRLAAIMAASALTLGGAVVTAQPAAAEGACTITDYSPRTVKLGISPKSVTFDVHTAGCITTGWGVDIDGTPPSGYTWLVFAYESHPSEVLNPSWDLQNRDAGYAFDVVTEADDESWSTTTRVFRDSFRVKRNTYISGFNASPEPVQKYGWVRLRGKLNVADWDNGRYVAAKYRWVNIQFKPAGTNTWITRKMVKTNGYGWVDTHAQAYTSGTWRLNYGGNAQFGNKVGPGDYVAVR